jgi:hypothetical protein
MPVTTIESAYGTPQGVNAESQKVINQLNGYRSAEEMIGEYFGLVKEFRYTDGTTSVTAVPNKEVDEYVNEFKDAKVLKEKGVSFVPYFAEKGMTKEMFEKAVKIEAVVELPLEVVTHEIELPLEVVTPIENGNTNDTGDTEPQGEPSLSNSSTGARKSKK